MFFSSFWIVVLVPSGKKQKISRDSTIVTIFFISSFDVTRIVLLKEAVREECLPDPKIFSCIPASAADVAAVNPKGINKTFSANGLITFLINNLQRLYEDLQLVYWFIIIYEENLSRYPQPDLMIFLELL